jgi:release factor glutamine methyltransferase
LKWRLRTVTLGNWLTKGLKKIKEGNREHSSSLFSIARSSLNQPTSWLLANPEYTLDSTEEISLNSSLSRFLSGEPLAYIVRSQYFYGIDFFVNSDVLIPRPETELLVNEAIKIANTNQSQEKTLIADVGTGSGCIAISLAKAIRNSEVIATDISYKALCIANRNIQKNEAEKQVHLAQASLLNGIDTKFDLICANLPYIPTNTLKKLTDLKYEPGLALDGGSDGLYLILLLLNDIKNKIQPNGTILLEIESSQKQSVLHICNKLFPKSLSTVLNDLAGLPRLAIIILTE